MNKYKILFVATPISPFDNEDCDLDQKAPLGIFQPLGLCYLGSVLQRAGFAVEIFDPHIAGDGCRTFEEPAAYKKSIEAKIEIGGFDCLGISAPFIYMYQWAHYVAAVAKKHFPDIPVIGGHGYPSLMTDHAMRDVNIDFVSLGEGESNFLKLITALRAGDDKAVSQIDGVAWRDADGEVRINPKSEFIDEIDNLPFPDWSLAAYENYFNYLGKRSLVMMSSRGCPYQCTFCCAFRNFGKRFRKRTVENVLAEIDYLVDQYRTEEVVFIDDNITIDKRRFLQIAEGIKQRNLIWDIRYLSSFTTDREMLVAMKESRCQSINLSIESAVPRVLEQLRKPLDLNQATEIIETCKEIKLPCSVNYIVGLPYETKEDIVESLEFSARVRADWNCYTFLWPVPGTEIYDFCLEHDYFIDKELDLSRFHQREIFVQNEHWDADWIREIVYDYNIRTNFLENYNLVGGGILDNAVLRFESIAKRIPDHAIANVCLAYAYELKGDKKQRDLYIDLSEKLFERANVRKIYEKYLDFEGVVIDFYNKQIASRHLS